MAVEADLALEDAPVSAALRRVLRQAAHLLGPIDPPAALGATLASRLHGVPELRETLDRYRATPPRPLLEPLSAILTPASWPLFSGAGANPSIILSPGHPTRA